MQKTDREISTCRLCGAPATEIKMTLGDLYFTGIFPKKNEDVPLGLLSIFECNVCGLVQTTHNFDRLLMYGENYGYRSGLNSSMVNHLRKKVIKLLSKCATDTECVVIDIGSNDGTLLNNYPETFRRIGVDPTITKFSTHYKPGIEQIADFFDETTLNVNANIITTISMFYDLPDPHSFIENLLSNLDRRSGIWHMEQAYWPQTVHTLGYDTICHEHLEYYTLSTILWIAQFHKLKILDIGFNDINGGSFYVELAHSESIHEPIDQTLLDWLLQTEAEFLQENPLSLFEQRMRNHAYSLNHFLTRLVDSNHSIIALGASTKGNVLLQMANLNSSLISGIGEINEDKFGKFTPGTLIEIFKEDFLLEKEPDFALILPWHFATGIIEGLKSRFPNTRIIIPLPQIRIL